MAAINPHGPAIGDRPTVLMAYLEYPKYVPPMTVCHRDEDGVDHMFPWAKDVNEERARVDERNRTGWASDGRHAYVPLGNPEDFPYDALEIRERLTKATAKPKIVLPKRERKRSKSGGLSAEDDETSAERLFVDTPVQGSVKQFCYQYYRFDLKQPKKNLVLKLTAVDGDPDLFVSNELETPKQDPNEHIWRGAAAGDDELLISIDHPRYALGTYWIGVYSVRDSHFELTAHLKEPPTEIVMDFNERKLGNGYAPLAQLVSKSDSRRKACKFDIAGRSEKPTPNDPLSLFKTLPEHLKELANLKKSAVAAADGNKSGGGSSSRPQSRERVAVLPAARPPLPPLRRLKGRRRCQRTKPRQSSRTRTYRTRALVQRWRRYDTTRSRCSRARSPRPMRRADRRICCPYPQARRPPHRSCIRGYPPSASRATRHSSSGRSA